MLSRDLHVTRLHLAFDIVAVKILNSVQINISGVSLYNRLIEIRVADIGISCLVLISALRNELRRW